MTGRETPPLMQSPLTQPSPGVFSAISQGPQSMSRYADKDYDIAGKFPLYEVFPEHLARAFQAEAKSLRTHSTAIATAFMNTVAVCSGLTFARGVGGSITRPHHNDTNFAATGSGKSAGIECAKSWISNIQRVSNEVLPLMDLDNILVDDPETEGIPMSFTDRSMLSKVRVDASRIPHVIESQTLEGAISIMFGGRSQSLNKKAKKSATSPARNSLDGSHHTEEQRNVVICFDEAAVFEANLSRSKIVVGQIETLYVINHH